MRERDEHPRVLPGMLEIGGAADDELWDLSVARDTQRKREELDAERYRYHAGQAERLRETMMELINHHESRALKLLERKES